MVNVFGGGMKKPTLEDVNEYMIERGVSDLEQAEAFYDYQESSGWTVGRKPMKCWKAAIRTWIRNTKKWENRNVQAQTSKQAYQQESFADQQRRAAARAYEQIQEMELTNGNANVRAIRKAG